MTAGAFGDKDLEDLLATHGPDASRWPEDARQPALALLASSPAARALLDEARQLDAGLTAVFAAPPLPVGLRSRILAVAQPSPTWIDWLTTKMWRPLSLACVPLVFGFAAGLNYAEDTADLEEDVLAAITETDFVEFESWDL